ncbi:PMT6 [Candida pseudojiufengensis]|uniref:PMT6 n=1 Tax=Candida pseudojiufengensis TaxID=497109 RepID=UPI0022252219|nr:PMT6 [Candida pseudojiufengensis]KAI5965844.1 PMT6 [Candida pseudojiufengensis]
MQNSSYSTSYSRDNNHIQINESKLQHSRLKEKYESNSIKDLPNGIDEIIEKTSKLQLSTNSKRKEIFVNVLNPLILTAISAFVRIHKIDAANRVIWDEAHFGKFGSHYLKREFYFDVHPPLGKLLVALSGYLAGYNGDFTFESGLQFPESMNFTIMRIFNCMFGILITPIAYRTAVLLEYSQLTCWFISLMVIFEQMSLTLSKFILLDSMLLFFVAFTFFGLINTHKLIINKKEMSMSSIKWFIITGISIGCVCSVKWVGLFVTALVGIYTVFYLVVEFYKCVASKERSQWIAYTQQWILRIFTLILIPLSIYMLSFKVHFLTLNHTGPGDGSISTLLQASLIGNTIQAGPRSVADESLITLRSQGLSPNLLHSHAHTYPEGSQEQQVTTYGFKDDNNDFIVELKRLTESNIIQNHDIIRLRHKKTGCHLTANAIGAPISKNHYEVSCSNPNQNNDKHEWIIEIQSQEISPSIHFHNESGVEIHPISTNFRLKHKVLGCYLATTGKSLPSWGYQQGEVICRYSLFSKDKNTWWNVEGHINENLNPPSFDYVPPKPKFWKEFLVLNYGMMASNSALVPDYDKFDKLSSEWWEWPILNTGLRMCGWGEHEIKYFLIGNPFVTWFSTFCLGTFLFYVLFKAFQYQRQWFNYSKNDDLLGQGILPFLGWAFNFFPFIFMGRVKYLHHYVPALYFAIFVSGFMMEKLIYQNRYFHKFVTQSVYIIGYFFIIYSFWYLKELALGMEGSSKQYHHKKLLDSWMI